MPYGWANEVTQYSQLKVHFSIGDGTLDVDLAGALLGDEHTEADAALLMGKIKDALENANLTVGTIFLDGMAWQTLTEL